MSSASQLLKNYDIAEPTVRKLYDSKLRLAILDALHDGPMRLADLRREVNSNAPNTSTKAKDLEDMGLVERDAGDYRLTPYGRAVRAHTKEAFEFYSTYEKFKEFWESHRTDGIPDYLWSRISGLKDAEFSKNTEVNVVLVHEMFMEYLKSIEKFFYGVSPIFHKEWLGISEFLVEKSVETKLVLTSDVLDLVSRHSSDKFKDMWETSKIELYEIKGDVTPAFTVSDKGLSLSLKEKRPPFTCLDMQLEGGGDSAIKWGLDLFEYYKKQAKPVKP